MIRFALVFGGLQLFLLGTLAQSSEIQEGGPSMSYFAQGDIDCSGEITLKDAIKAFQVSANMNPLTICSNYADSGADFNGDRRIGVQDAVYILQILSNARLRNMMVNPIGMTFKLIPAGTFMMGSPTDEPGRDDNEVLHEVTLTKSFYIQTTEVTQGQWKAAMGSNPSYFSDCGDDCPVEQVSFDDVQAFIAEMNKLGEGTYRLPTEAEWEYAARAGSTTAFANGNITDEDYIDPNLDVIGWYYWNADFKTHPVAQRQPNAWGLFDMHGNVTEWCEDWYGDYPAGPVTDPKGPDWSIYSYERVIRSGCYKSFAWACRSANRNGLRPEGRSKVDGFRLVWTQGQ